MIIEYQGIKIQIDLASEFDTLMKFEPFKKFMNSLFSSLTLALSKMAVDVREQLMQDLDRLKEKEYIYTKKIQAFLEKHPELKGFYEFLKRETTLAPSTIYSHLCLAHKYCVGKAKPLYMSNALKNVFKLWERYEAQKKGGDHDVEKTC